MNGFADVGEVRGDNVEPKAQGVTDGDAESGAQGVADGVVAWAFSRSQRRR